MSWLGTLLERSPGTLERGRRLGQLRRARIGGAGQDGRHEGEEPDTERRDDESLHGKLFPDRTGRLRCLVPSGLQPVIGEDAAPVRLRALPHGNLEVRFG